MSNPLSEWHANYKSFANKYIRDQGGDKIMPLAIRAKFILQLINMIAKWTNGKTVIKVTEQEISKRDKRMRVEIERAKKTRNQSKFAKAVIAASPYVGPIQFFRNFVASCPIKNKNFRAIAKFSRGYVFDVGAGSGYNAQNLQSFGAKYVYAFDKKNSPYQWETNEFFPVDRSSAPNKKNVLKIVKAGGAALWSWPLDNFYQLDFWLACGGRKIITIGNTHPAMFDKSAPTCPIFPPVDFAAWSFKCTGSTPLVTIEDDKKETESIMKLWLVKDKTAKKKRPRRTRQI